MAEKLVLIDGHSILNRAFYGVPDLTNSAGLHTNAIYGFLNILFKILDEEKPSHLAVAFDVSAPTFRHKIYKEYKGTRKPMAEELRQQVPVMKDVLKSMNILVMEKEGLEADDILGTMAKRAEAAGFAVSLVSGDRDLLQIATKQIKIRIPKTKGGRTEIEDYYEKDVLERYQVTPLQFIELKALMGDTSDNIPGVPKVGEKTAMELMKTFGSLSAIYERLEEVGKKSIKESLAANRELADLSKVLATIHIDADISYQLEEAKITEFYTPEAYQHFMELEFKNWLNRFENKPEDTKLSDIEKGFIQILSAKELALLCEEWKKEESIGIKIYGKDSFRLDKEEKEYEAEENGQLSLFLEEEGDGLKTKTSEICFAISCGKDEKGKTYYASHRTINKEELQQALLGLYRESDVRFVTCNVKELYRFFAPAMEERGDEAKQAGERFLDAVIAAYLLNPLKNDYSCEDIAREFLNLQVPEYEALFGKKNKREAFLEKEDAFMAYICREAYIAHASGSILTEMLCQKSMNELFADVEMPLSYVLYSMEQEGILVEEQKLKEYGDSLQKSIEELEEKIYRDAGKKFNINSPKQLGELLFEEMKIPGGKKTKTGFSTSAEVLEKLAPSYEIVKNILEYRTVAKLKSTYADGLAAFIEADGRIRTNFNQTNTATGRISSTEPNLQNIPMRMELGRQIRKVFIAKEGHVFVDADYSQIELRILASLAGDKELIEAYHSNKDIHKSTASKVFKVPFEEVTDLQRRNAKAVNFGIVYGISSFGLSQDLSISKKEAQKYIEDYFETYPGIKQYLEETKEFAKEKGYSLTFFGRRRPIPELKSSNFMQRSFGERVAMNAPIQGTAADIMKIAMILVFRRLKEETESAKLILQVHDELVVEVKEEEKDKVIRILEEEMKKAADFPVALEVEAHYGKDWYEAK